MTLVVLVFFALLIIGVPIAHVVLISAAVGIWMAGNDGLILVQQTDLQPLTVAMPRFLGLYIQDWQYLFTVALIAIVPVIVLFALIEKRLIGGLTAGSVK